MTSKSQISKHKRLLNNTGDYSRAVTTLTWQRQALFACVSILTGWFFDPLKSALFFAVCMGCEYVDLWLARKVEANSRGDLRVASKAKTGYLINTVVSALAICAYAIWVGITEDGVGMFTALFCLFSAAIYAAINNHQLLGTLVIRLTLYGLSFVIITARDLWVYRPPLTSDMWLQFFTVIYVMYFLIDCSLGFLGMYRQNLQRLEDLEIEHERAKAALVLKSQFVAVVSHELRTPLTSIKGSLDLLSSGKFGEITPQTKSLLDLAGRNSQRLARLVDDLLDLQKLEEGKIVFEKETINVGEFVADAINSHQGLAERYNVHLKGDLNHSGAVYVQADPSRLMQVMGNIISNAAKFSDDEGDVEIGFTTSNGRVRIFVTDQGVGIPEGSEDEVFGRFIQLDSSDQRKFGGTGLGMNISREIIEAIGGTISYESELGVGTTFFIELPCAVVHETAQKSESLTQRPFGSAPMKPAFALTDPS